MPAFSSLPVNPAILRWAREDAGLSLEEAASRAKIAELKPRGKSQGFTPWQRLASIEDGVHPVTPSLLKALAKAYCRPEVTFFLPFPPAKEEFLADFRTVDSRSHPRDSPEFAALKRHITSLHKGLRDIAEADGALPLSFVNSISPDVSIHDFVVRIKNVLGGDPREVSRSCDENGFFKALREQAQQVGIYVILLGDLGSYHSAVSVDEFRGICIADPLVPLIVINPYDALKARVFSLMHEICHIFLGLTGVSNDGGISISSHDRERERLCNAVAAEYLVPMEKMRLEHIGEPLFESLNEIAKKFKVSLVVIARRALESGKITGEDYGCIARLCRENARHRSSGQKGGPDANIVTRSHLGKKLISTVLNAVDNGYIDFSDASVMLGISIARLPKVAS